MTSERFYPNADHLAADLLAWPSTEQA